VKLAIARGDSIGGLGTLAQAAEREAAYQRQYADPPFYPEPVYPALGEAYLQANSAGLAAQAFEKGLELTKNDLYSLSGLVRAYAAVGKTGEAKDAMARLLYVTRNADKGLKVLERARAVGVTAEARAAVPAAERDYARVDLSKYGPAQWQPYDAPALDVRDAAGKKVSLAEYRGKNVLLVFYLGFECPHCMRQLHAIQKKKDEWEELNTVVLAVSSASPEKNAAGLKQQGDLAGVRLLSDAGFANARRFHSYDDFEEIELHSTILIDGQGRVYWARFGGDPFDDMEFLGKQLRRMNERK
jgi:peroxiredoxin